MTKTRWGILGCGRIAGAFAEGLTSVDNAELVAVGSRSAENAEAFGAKHGAENRHGSYAALAADPDVDAIYVATPHPMHEADSILCLEGGKAVVTEKPFTINAAQAQRVVQKAREKNLFLLEAHWTRFLPLMGIVRELVADGAIGEVKLVEADFGFRAGFDPKNRLFDPALGGGALLDVGCYCVSLAVMLLGAPDEITGIAQLGETGVDELAVMDLGYQSGAIAHLSTAVRLNTRQDATITGTEGRIHIHNPWWKPEHLTLHRSGKSPETVSAPITGNGFNYEAQAAMDCIAAGKIESDVMPHEQTIEIMRIMDTLRAKWGVRYPGE